MGIVLNLKQDFRLTSLYRVALSDSEGFLLLKSEILRSAQNDKRKSC
jgi:hypothetical protein